MLCGARWQQVGPLRSLHIYLLYATQIGTIALSTCGRVRPAGGRAPDVKAHRLRRVSASRSRALAQRGDLVAARLNQRRFTGAAYLRLVRRGAHGRAIVLFRQEPQLAAIELFQRHLPVRSEFPQARLVLTHRFCGGSCLRTEPRSRHHIDVARAQRTTMSLSVRVAPRPRNQGRQGLRQRESAPPSAAELWARSKTPCPRDRPLNIRLEHILEFTTAAAPGCSSADDISYEGV